LVREAHARLTLRNGKKLVTLEDVRRVLLTHLVMEVEHHALGNAMRLLLIAAETGISADRKAATDQVALVLRSRAAH
jgi:hypothetical protein